MKTQQEHPPYPRLLSLPEPSRLTLFTEDLGYNLGVKDAR